MTDPKKPIALEERHHEGARLFSPSAGRNREVIGDILAGLIPTNASVLEIASGTGEHAVHMCGLRPDIFWQPSDPDGKSRASQNSWRLDVPDQMKPSLSIDTMQDKWWVELGGFDTMFCANMIHIAPWEAAIGLAKGADVVLSENGEVYLYGPFQDGAQTAPSNLDFDRSLQSRNPLWGVRKLDSVKHIFADAGFNSCVRIVMPKNNLILKFSRRS